MQDRHVTLMQLNKKPFYLFLSQQSKVCHRNIELYMLSYDTVL